MATTFSSLTADIEALRLEVASVSNFLGTVGDTDEGQNTAISEALTKVYENGQIIEELQTTVRAMQEEVYTRLQNIETVLI